MNRSLFCIETYVFFGCSFCRDSNGNSNHSSSTTIYFKRLHFCTIHCIVFHNKIMPCWIFLQPKKRNLYQVLGTPPVDSLTQIIISKILIHFPAWSIHRNRFQCMRIACTNVPTSFHANTCLCTNCKVCVAIANWFPPEWSRIKKTRSEFRICSRICWSV